MFNFKDLKKQIAGIAGERRQLARDLEQKRQRKEFLESAPPPLDEHLQRLDHLVDQNAREYDQTLRDLTQSKELKPFDAYGELTSFVARGASVQQFQRALCGLLQDEVKAGIRRAAESWDWHPPEQCGPPMKERRAELEKLGKEIADIEEKLQKLDNEAAASGIRLDGSAVPVSTAGPRVGKTKPSKFGRWLANEERPPAPGDDGSPGNDDTTPDENGSDEAADTEDPKGSGVVKESAAEE